MKQITGGVTAAKGYKAAATAAGIKYQDRTDMAMVYSEVPSTVAGTFTTNVFKAAPVIWDRNIVKNSGKAQAIVVNSGIAKVIYGEGYPDDFAMKIFEEAGVEVVKMNNE